MISDDSLIIIWVSLFEVPMTCSWNYLWSSYIYTATTILSKLSPTQVFVLCLFQERSRWTRVLVILALSLGRRICCQLSVGLSFCGYATYDGSSLGRGSHSNHGQSYQRCWETGRWSKVGNPKNFSDMVYHEISWKQLIVVYGHVKTPTDCTDWFGIESVWFT